MAEDSEESRQPQPDASGDRVIQVGPCRMKFVAEEEHTVDELPAPHENPRLMPLRDSSHLVRKKDSRKLLTERLERDGYLFIRGAIDRETVLRARSYALRGNILDPERDVEEGVLLKRCGLGCVPYLEGRNEITHSEVVKNVLEGERLREIFEEHIFGEKVTTFDFKWLRAMPHEKFTGCHVDSVYMSRGTQRLLTTWIPFGDVPMEMGTVAVCEGSHRLATFEQFQATYGRLDTEAKEGFQGTGWFTEDPSEISRKFGGQWRSEDFKAGDILIFGMRTVHMSTRNMTDKARVSCDVRWQPAAAPVDKRYMGNFEREGGEKKVGGAYASDEKAEGAEKEGFVVTMSDLKREWGV